MAEFSTRDDKILDRALRATNVNAEVADLLRHAQGIPRGTLLRVLAALAEAYADYWRRTGTEIAEEAAAVSRAAGSPRRAPSSRARSRAA